jgi:hypothetical protein
VTTTMPARMNVAVIIRVRFSRSVECAKGGGAVPLLVVTGKRGGESVEQPGLPKRSIGLLKGGIPVGSAMVLSADAPVEGAVADVRRVGRRLLAEF